MKSNHLNRIFSPAHTPRLPSFHILPLSPYATSKGETMRQLQLLLRRFDSNE
ncbi:hypothetical protein [Bacteroides caecimuris]|uniref:hypothetical protein n=1 Tax=Bacteroides caecimuris TaxID=1796613 RepID=UPI00263AB193|nr:hypothetical protein [Bacteroides caecimuris]